MGQRYLRMKDQKKSRKSARAFPVGFGPKVDQNFGLNSGLRRTFCFT